jgi:hypothetical protein
MQPLVVGGTEDDAGTAVVVVDRRVDDGASVEVVVDTDEPVVDADGSAW